MTSQANGGVSKWRAVAAEGGGGGPWVKGVCAAELCQLLLPQRTAA